MKRCTVYAMQHSVVVVVVVLRAQWAHGSSMDVQFHAMQIFTITVIINTCHTPFALHLSKSVNPPHTKQPKRSTLN